MKTTTENRTIIRECDLIWKKGIKCDLSLGKISGSQTAFKVLSKVWDENIDICESFYVLLVDRANNVIGYKKISQGGTAGTVADPKLIFVTALNALAAGIILAHNHPSGNLTPSHADITLTKQLWDAGKFLEIPILDHLILGPNKGKYLSFADEGFL